MLIHVYNQDLIKIGILNEDTTLIYNRKYNTEDTFQLFTNLDKNKLKVLKEGNLIKLDNDNTLSQVIFSEKVLNKNSAEEVLEVKGKEVSTFLNRRRIQGMYQANESIPIHIKNIIYENIIDPSDSKRKIENFEFRFDKTIDLNSYEKTRFQNSYGDVFDVVKKLCLDSDLGFKSILENEKIIFILYKGEDKSLNQTKNRPVIFSKDRENIIGQRHLIDNENYKNVALVAGQGEGEDRVTTVVGDEDTTGLDRYETFIDARDLDFNSEEDELTLDEYIKMLKNRGNSKMKDFKSINNYEAEIDPYSNLSYKEDFEIGDLVETYDSEWDIKLTNRIVGIEEIYQQDFELSITFGSIVPTIFDEIQSIKQDTSVVPTAARSTSGQDGQQGEQGMAGVGLEYDWDNTRLGVKKESDTTFEYVDLKGEKGDTGKQGEQGIAGKNGVDGKQGPQGIQGIPGKDGINGTIGPQGPPGKDGKQGLPGKNGTDASVTKAKIVEELGYTPLQQAFNILSKDTRSEKDTPASKNDKSITVDFKSLSAADNPPVKASNSYVYIVNVSGYGSETDISGGLPTQIAVGKNNLAIRWGIDAKTWSNWETVANLSDIPKNISWDKVTNKPSSFNPATHTHAQYATNIKVNEVEKKIDSLDIPEGVDLTPINEKINNLENKQGLVLIEENNIQYYAKYVIKNNKPFLEVVERK